MAVSYSVLTNSAYSYDREIIVTPNSWYTDAICGISLLSAENDSAKSITIRIKKSTSSSLGQAKLVARLYKAKPFPANYPQPYLFDTATNNPDKYGLAVSDPVLLEGLINHTSFTDVTFTFPTPLIAETGYNGRYVVVIMPAFTGYGEWAAVGSMPPDRSTAGLPDNVSILIAGNRTPMQQLNTFLTCASWSSSYGMSANYYDQMVMQIDGVPSNTNPTNIILSSTSISENSPALSSIGYLSVTDLENSPQTYSLVTGTGDTDNNLFEILGNNLRLKSGTSLNYETKNSYSVRIKATDSTDSTYFYEKVFIINVSNANEAPTNIVLSALSITEGNAINAEIGTLTGVDPDTNDSLLFSIPEGMGNDKFNVTQISGAWKLRASVPFDYETATSHSVTVRATDGNGLTYDKAFTISILNDTGDDAFPLTNANSVALSGGITVASVDVNPTLRPVLKNGNALPNGSIVKYSVTGQKFIKVDGSDTSYEAIPVTPPANWNWSQELIDAWAVLNSF